MLLIADSGSTKTTWSFINKKNEIKTFTTNGINPYYQSENEIYETLKIDFIKLKYQNNDIDKLIFYGAGCNGENVYKVTLALETTFPLAKNIEVYSDMIGAARAVCGNDYGIACILGTGSNSCLFDGKKIIEEQFSLGFWLGDEGSGGHLGKTFLQYYMRDELPDDLYKIFVSEFTLSKSEILNFTYNKPYPNRFFASFVPFLHKNQSNSFVYSLIKKSFCEFFDRYIKKYTDYKNTKINFIGSVAYHFREIIKEITSEEKLEIGKIIQSPSEGLIEYHLKNYKNIEQAKVV